MFYAMHELENLDLNRLLVLHWLLEDAHVTRAARHLGSTQPAVSRSLRELRDWFKDPLLVREGHRMVRTSLAEGLRPRLGCVIAELRDIARPPGSFEPRRARGTVRVACTDYIASVVLDGWSRAVAPRAPGLNLELRNLTSESRKELEAGTLDLAIQPGRVRGGETGLVHQVWFEDRYASWVRPQHPLAGKRIGLRRFAALDHLQIGSGRPPASEIDRAFRAGGFSRRIAVRVESFLLAARALAASDLIATLPHRFGAQAGVPLREVKTPLELAPFTVDLVWHPRQTGSESHAFVRDALGTSARGR